MQLPLTQDRREIRPLDVRHRDVLDAVDLAEVVNADDVAVSDLPCEQQLLFEAPLDVLGRGGVSRDLGANDLQRDRDFQFGVPCLIDGAHPADAELLQNVIPGSELLPNREWP